VSKTSAVSCLSVVALCALCGVGAADGGGESAGYALPKDIELGPGVIELGARLRARYEWFDHFNLKTFGTNRSDQVLGEKVWLDLGYRMGSNATAFIRLQDAHFWLSDYEADDFTTAALPACPHQNPFDIREAYLDVRRLAESPVGIKAGRQTIVYGDQRIWAPGDWSNSGKFTWDAVKVMWQSPVANVDGLYARRVIPDPDEFDRDHYDFDAWGLYATVRQFPFDLDLFYVLKIDDHGTTIGELGTNNLALNALGARLNWKPAKGTEVGGLLVYEYGDWGADDLEAFGGAVSAGYTASCSCKPGAKVSYAYASGDRNPKDGKHETFDMLFGSVSQYYGLMNLVSWMNLHDYQLDLMARAGWLDKVLLSYHYFQLAEARDGWYYCTEKTVQRDKTGASGTDLGQEIDLVLSKAMGRNLAVDMGVGHFFAGEFAERVGSGRDADWVYLQSMLSF
jgi:hypothetical protein